MKHQTLDDVVLISGGVDSADTHRATWFSKVWNDFIDTMPDFYTTGADPFARDCQLANYTNDLDENTKAQEHKPALEFLQQFKTDSLDYVIFDPPFSQRQADDHYDGIGYNLYASNGVMISNCLDECARIVKPGGFILKFGYNCNIFHNNFKLCKIWLIQKIPRTHNHTTIISLWQNQQKSLNDF
jgi:tRNA1(Val) A37 N6-methylase TrmN6